MANVNPPPIRVPESVKQDPELFQFYQSLLFHLQQLWRRTGGGEDFIQRSIVTSGGTLSVSPNGKQNHSPTLESIGFLGTAADKGLYTTGVETYAEFDLTAFARSVLDDPDEATFKATVNLEIGTDVQAYSANLDEAGTFFGSTDISAAEAETLTTGSNADSLHVHAATGLTGYEDSTWTVAWTGTSSNPSIGSGTLTGRYIKIGSVVHAWVHMIIASDTTFGSGTYGWSLPYASAASPGRTTGSVWCLDSGTGYFMGSCQMRDSSSEMYCYTTTSLFGPTSPFTWADGDQLVIQITYRV